MSIPLFNPILAKQSDDNLYHFGLARSENNFEKMFGDVQFVCCGGSGPRLKLFAEKFASDTGLKTSENLSKSDRFVLYKTGPVLWMNHGMGNPSMGIMLNEAIKLLHYARVQNVTIFRLGTSGGIGVTPGTAVISTGVLNAELNESYTLYVMGEKKSHPAKLDSQLSKELKESAKQLDIPAKCGKTFCADDFYEGQARLDGEFCDYTADNKLNFLKKLHDKGVRNVEMESTCFASLTSRAGIRAGIVCVALLNRLERDQIKIDRDTYVKYEMRPYMIIANHIRKQIGK